MRVRLTRVHVAVIGVVFCAAAAAPLAQSAAPLPDVAAFSAEVRRHLMSDRALQSQYTFLEHREEVEVSKLGKVSKGPLKVFEVYPAEEWEHSYRRLVSVNGVPVPPAELDKQDRKHREDVLKEFEKHQRESPAEKARRERERQKDRAEEQATIDEAFRLFDITLLRREMVRGHQTVVARLEPRPNYQARTDVGKFLRKFRAVAWVNESDYQMVRLEAEAIEDVTFGWGLVGRLHKGAKGIFERTLVNGEVWLPSRTAFTGTGRALLFRTFDINTVTTYSDYKKFRVDTNEAYSQKD